MSRRGANWTPPSDGSLSCFAGKLGEDEVCAGCGKHIKRHFGGTQYRCQPVPFGHPDYTGIGVHAQAGDAVNNPPHYAQLAPHEPIDVIERWGLGFCLGNVVKYIARAGRKGSALDDLRKARVYLDRDIARREREAGGG